MTALLKYTVNTADLIGDDVHSFASEHICLCAHDFCMPQRALSNANEKRPLVCV